MSFGKKQVDGEQNYIIGAMTLRQDLSQHGHCFFKLIFSPVTTRTMYFPPPGSSEASLYFNHK